jgi:predicted helicase
MMAGKAKLMADVIEKSLHQDDEDQKRSQIKSQMLSFQQMLIHDIDNKAFADIYAQTIAYGMFAARYHDPTLPTFSRQEAAELIPKSNPFLRKLFQDIAGYDLDNRLVWIVDELVSIFLASDVANIMKNFGKSTKQEDPVVHFYETFLGEYNPALRKARGVWYTPQPVVNFIVRAVDDILKTEFDLPQGLADTSKTKVKVDYYGKKIEKEVHKVQILDPATGTGTFLAEVVKYIYKKFEGQQGIWSKYVTNDLIPRLNGFELLMASYAMAHLKMDMLLTETGYRPPPDASGPEGGAEQQRLKIFLTNSLEEAHQDSGTLFSSWLSDESNQANEIKRDTPVMVIIGNPPYSGESANKGEWIMNLMEDYKKEPGGIEKLKERNSKSINDDYVKFIRLSQFLIDKNGEGILGFINPHGFLDNPTYRGMRWNLLQSFDKIYTIDLNGNSKKKSTSEDIVDQNVFDIMQGVSVNLFIKTGKKAIKDNGKVYYFDLFGKRDFKYDFLIENTLKSIPYSELTISSPNFIFRENNFEDSENYNKGIKIDDLFGFSNSGIAGGLDRIFINFKKEDSQSILKNLKEKNFDYFTNFFKITKSDKNKIDKAIIDIKTSSNPLIEKMLYRSFDFRYTIYTGKGNGIMERPRSAIMHNFIRKDNIGIILNKQHVNEKYTHVSITNKICNKGTHYLGSKGNDYLFPLYLYPDDKNKDLFETGQERTPNLNMEIVNQIATGLGLSFSPLTPEGGITRVATTPPLGAGGLLPIDILDYIYAVLHSPTYREKYKEFLKIDFPRVPYPKDQATFWQLVKLGSELRQIHLLESSIVEKYITQYPEDGDNVVTKPRYEINPNPDRVLNPVWVVGKVHINETQYFNNVPEVAWNFYIGGYQPAQKWLKDRKDRELSYEDILHYQKIIVALSETDRIMKEIDEIEI